jgi:hypothetical protein
MENEYLKKLKELVLTALGEEKEGVVANSPKACFREIFSLGFSSEKETVQLQERY